jgi:hypothetical protein
MKRLREYPQTEGHLERIIGRTNTQLCDEVPVKELEVQEALRKENSLGLLVTIDPITVVIGGVLGGFIVPA